MNTQTASTTSTNLQDDNVVQAFIQGLTPETGLRLGGKPTASSSGTTFAVLDPATGQEVARISDGTVSDALRAVEAADAASADWAATTPRHRSDVLRRAFELMNERVDVLAQLISLENGKALPDARGEVLYAAEFFRWYSEEAVRSDGAFSTAPAGGVRNIVTHRPVGVSLLVTPWNFPAAMAARKIGPALAAGCTVVLKPASDTPLTALAVADILELPQGPSMSSRDAPQEISSRRA
jgi:succinate-semialdehyde dehydrogenase / glutarate-semialdehyde dehydrogenase